MHPRLALGSVLLLSALPARAADASATLVMSHSGYLLDGLDKPVDNPSLPVTFALYDRDVQSVGEQKLWEGSCTTEVRRGFYNVHLGEGCGTELRVSYLPSNAQRYLEVKIGGAALSPRLRIGTVPTAAVANDAILLGGQAPSAYWTKSEDLAFGILGNATLGETVDALKAKDSELASSRAALAGDQTFTGTNTFAPADASLPPFSVASSVVVERLNADLLDGKDSAHFATAQALEIASSTTTSNLTALGTRATATEERLTTAENKFVTYLPLAGGSLTGALTGTAATFSGNVAVQGQLTVSGNLGVGVTSPGAKLHVGGDLRVDGLGGKVLYHRTYTAMDLGEALPQGASLGGSANLSNGRLDFTAGSFAEQLIHLPLIPAGRLAADRSYGVRIEALVEELTSDCDPIFAISDGTDSVGFQRSDVGNSSIGSMIESATNYAGAAGFGVAGANSSSRRTWTRVDLRLSPGATRSVAWADPYVPPARGRSTRILNADQGLTFQMRANDVTEKYGLHHLEITVFDESP